MNARALPAETIVRPSPRLTVNPAATRFRGAIQAAIRRGGDDLRLARRRAALRVIDAVMESDETDTIRGFEAILNGCLDAGYRTQALAAFVFDVLHRRLASRVRRRLAACGQDSGSPEVADLVSAAVEGIQKLIRGANRERHTVRYALLVSIADHRTIDYLRRRRPEYRDTIDDGRTLADRSVTADELDNPERRLRRAERVALARTLRDVVIETVNSLPARERAALILVEVKGYGYGDVAAALGLKTTDVGNVVRRARLKRDRLLVPKLRAIRELDGHIGFSELQDNRALRTNMLQWSADMGDGVCEHCLDGFRLHLSDRDQPSCGANA